MEKFAKRFRQWNRVLITTHVMPDGDGLGSEMALYGYFRNAGKEATVINTHPTPAKFSLVDPGGVIQVYTPGMSLPKVDAVLVVDTSEPRMLGPLEAPLVGLGVPMVFMDHHVSEKDPSAGHLIDESFGSTGELVHALLGKLGAEITLDVALGIYVAIVTDTSSFRFKRTTAQSHLIAAELLDKGISAEEVYRRIYARDSFAKIRLFGHALEQIKSSDGDRIAWLVITKEMRNHYHATVEDTEAFVTQLTLIDGVEIGMLFREEDDGQIKVSLRGNNEVPVFAIAKKFGGGGHRHAAGIKLAMPLNEAIRQVHQAAQETLTSAAAKRPK